MDFELEPEVIRECVQNLDFDNGQAGISLAVLAHQCYGQSKKSGWWTDPATGEPLERNKPEMFALIHSELSEALEGVRKDLFDDHLPLRKMVEVEFADALIRIGDFIGGFFSQSAIQKATVEAAAALESDLDLLHPTLSGRIADIHIPVSMAHAASLSEEVLSEATLLNLCGCALMLAHAAKEFGFDLPGATAEKAAYNAVRLDHKLETRKAAGGKKF